MLLIILFLCLSVFLSLFLCVACLIAPKKLKPAARDTAIIALIVFTGFFWAGEAYVRIFKKDPPPFNVPSENPRLIAELNREREDINSFGMRDDELDPAAIQGRYKIAAIGDSHTYAIKVKKNQETFPSRLEYYLRQAPGQDSIEVLNFGVPGYNMAQELEVLSAKALPFAPDLVILQYTINDTHGTNYIQPKYKSINTLIHQSHLLVKVWQKILYSSFGRKYLYDWVGKNLPDGLLYQEGLVGTRKAAPDEEPARLHHPPRTKDRFPERYHYMLGEENWRRHVHSFALLCKQNHIPMLAMGFIGEEERAVFQEAGFDVYSFYEMFAGRDMRDYGYDPENTADHFDAQGNDFIGKALAEYIQRHYAP